eukprot:SM000343S12822  [mRNA]  locus=s343:59477:60344:+ [translate_table: standard]
MVDVSEKPASLRRAVATGRVLLGRAAFEAVRANQVAKGDVLTVAQIAGISGAKQAASLIPLCHNIFVDKVHMDLALDASAAAIVLRADVMSRAPTGAEMEALTAVAVAGLTVYDMVKALSKEAELTDIRLELKDGGKSGPWSRTALTAK